MARLTPTSYAILGLLAIKPWSTYELTMQMSRAVGHVWPRAESNLYQEPHRLVAAGLATAERRLVGRRQRTEYSITAAGRAELDAWLSEPAAPTVIESETLLKVLFGNRATPDVIVGHLRAFAEQAESGEAHWREIAHDYIEGRGPFPERLHVNTLFWVLLDRWARLRADWARWAESEVATWPTGDGPRDRAVVRRLLARALEDGSSLPRSTDLEDGRADG